MKKPLSFRLVYWSMGLISLVLLAATLSLAASHYYHLGSPLMYWCVAGSGVVGGALWLLMDRLKDKDAQVYALLVPAAGLPAAGVGAYIMWISPQAARLSNGAGHWADARALLLMAGFVLMGLVATGFFVQALLKAIREENNQAGQLFD